MADRRFANRIEAGQTLAQHLTAYGGRSNVVVLGLPRGGVPVAAEVARALHAPLDVFLVRKLGVPGHEELAMGAIAEGGVEVLDETLIRELRVPLESVERVAMRERLELNRRDRQYRGARARPDVQQRIVILVDDGMATGATMEAALVALRRLRPAELVAAAPVGAPDTCMRLRQFADRVVCAQTPDDLGAIGLWYDDFTETSDQDVRRLIGVAR